MGRQCYTVGPRAVKSATEWFCNFSFARRGGFEPQSRLAQVKTVPAIFTGAAPPSEIDTAVFSNNCYSHAE